VNLASGVLPKLAAANRSDSLGSTTSRCDPPEKSILFERPPFSVFKLGSLW